jgi:hypothetical protein
MYVKKTATNVFKVNLNVYSRKKRTFAKDFNFFTQPPPPLFPTCCQVFILLFNFIQIVFTPLFSRNFSVFHCKHPVMQTYACTYHQIDTEETEEYISRISYARLFMYYHGLINQSKISSSKKIYL